VYDFAGFDRRYFEMTYPTPDAGALAARVAAAMPDSEPVHQHAGRGLDHRAWVPLKVIYPDGDVPVLQLSMPPTTRRACWTSAAACGPCATRGSWSSARGS
jgi:4,5-DOPA dioxygenase extradiol